MANINIKELLDGVVISSGGSVETDPISFDAFDIDGIVGVYVKVEGSGKLNLDYKASYNGSDYLIPSEASQIITEMVAGEDIVSVEPILTPHFKFLVGAVDDDITVTLIVCFQ